MFGLSAAGKSGSYSTYTRGFSPEDLNAEPVNEIHVPVLVQEVSNLRSGIVP